MCHVRGRELKAGGAFPATLTADGWKHKIIRPITFSLSRRLGSRCRPVSLTQLQLLLCRLSQFRHTTPPKTTALRVPSSASRERVVISVFPNDTQILDFLTYVCSFQKGKPKSVSVYILFLFLTFLSGGKQ